MTPKQINLSDWTLFGGGGQGDSYNHKTDPALMLKLFLADYPIKSVTDELEISQRIYDLGIPTPKPGEFVMADGRPGIVFERIQNKISFSRAYANDSSLLDSLADRFAKIGRQIHATMADREHFNSMHKIFRFYMDNDPILTEEHRELCERALALIPEGDTCVHGDFHIGNVITDGQHDYLIDLGTFGYGRPEWDLSMFWFCANMTPAYKSDELFHLTPDQMKAFWDVFADKYYGDKRPAEDAFLPMFAPYIILRSLFFDVSCGGRDPIPLMIRGKLAELI